MRLAEITEPDPHALALAREVGDLYARLFDDLFRRLAADPPRGWRVDVRRRWAFIDPDTLGVHARRAHESVVRPRVEALLARHGWHLADWRKGFVEREVERTRPDTGEHIRRIERRRLVPVLREIADADARTRDEIEALIRAFEQDPTRRGASAERQGRRQVLVLTADPVENAHMSVRRGWTSCRDVTADYDGTRRHMLACDLRAGTLVLWLTDADDAETLDRPTARLAIRLFVLPGSDGPRAMHFRAEPRAYGDAPPGFIAAGRAVATVLDRFGGRIAGWYRPLHVFYGDRVPARLSPVDVDVEALADAFARNPEGTIARYGAFLEERLAADGELRRAFEWKMVEHPALLRYAERLGFHDRTIEALRTFADLRQGVCRPYDLLPVWAFDQLVPDGAGHRQRMLEVYVRCARPRGLLDLLQSPPRGLPPELRKTARMRLLHEAPLLYLAGTIEEPAELYLAAYEVARRNPVEPRALDLHMPPRRAADGLGPREHLVVTLATTVRGCPPDIGRYVPPDGDPARWWLAVEYLRDLDREVLQRARRDTRCPPLRLLIDTVLRPDAKESGPRPDRVADPAELMTFRPIVQLAFGRRPSPVERMTLARWVLTLPPPARRDLAEGLRRLGVLGPVLAVLADEADLAPELARLVRELRSGA